VTSILLDTPELDVGYSELGRHYITPEGKSYSSVTTVINFDKSGLDEWKQRVGEEEAERICTAAAKRGTAVHEMIEQYLLNQPVDQNEYTKLFKMLKWKLDNIDNIIGLETPLYSDGMKLAGRVDCVGLYKEVMSVIDFKTATKIKDSKWITDYWLQTTAYSLMIEELTDIKIPQLVILMVAENGDIKEFISDRDKWLEPLRQRILSYRQWVKR
jgi:genome maintenance exonuclease 1